MVGNLEEDHIQALVSHHILPEVDTGLQVAGRYDNPLIPLAFAIMKTSKAAHVVEVGLHTENIRLEEEEDKTCLEKDSWRTGGGDGGGNAHS